MIVLIGFMGAGKSTVGKKLARHLGLPFVDADDLIVAAAGQSIPEIFAERGEPGFRKLEAEVIIGELNRGDDGVFALGGGALESADVVFALRRHRVVWLKVTFRRAMQRVGSDGNRPMLADPELLQVFLRRQHRYEQAADYTIRCGSRTSTDVAQALYELFDTNPVE
ncbi:MAG: shikimate kinase [Propionibacteriaceae bacterium]|jgi:shikimate kinase|nr:shikimate kinase [Propionibacteriaceae bacterium]